MINRKIISSFLIFDQIQGNISFMRYTFEIICLCTAGNSNAGRTAFLPIISKMNASYDFTDLLCLLGKNFITVFSSIKYTEFISAKPTDCLLYTSRCV